jgi:hypothetical protein
MRFRVSFRKLDGPIGNGPADIHARAFERVLIVVAAMLVMAIAGTIELRMPPELQVGHFEEVYTSP